MQSLLAILTAFLAFATPAGALELVSRSPSGQVGTERSIYSSLSADGRWVVFVSRATNLLDDVGACSLQVQGDMAYVRDTLTGAIELLGGAIDFTSTAISATGRHVVYFCGGAAFCIRDRVANTTEELFPPSDYDPFKSVDITADGRFLAYQGSQVYVYDRCVSAGAPVGGGCIPGVKIMSVTNSGTPSNGPFIYPPGPDMTPDGRYVVFDTDGTNLPGGPGVFVRDRDADADGVFDETGVGETLTARVDGLDDGDPTSISDDGRYVTGSGNSGHLYVRDRVALTTELVDQTTLGVTADSSSSYPHISADGRYVVFRSHAFNLAGGDCAGYGCDDVYVRDRVNHTTERISESPTGAPSYTSAYPGGVIFGSIGISADGHRAVFATYANNLADHDDNGRADVFLWTDCAAAAPVCGDGSPYAGCETCDDGNAIDDDGCDSTCRVTGCGSGVPTGTETCDDGNRIEGDGCDTNCTPSSCGNGIRAGGEACDDGNTIAGDGCSPTCTLELASYIAGSGKPETDCWHEWRTDPPTLPDRKGLPRRELKCTDDDPGCDFGVSGDHACTFHVRMCFNVLDSRLGACTPTEIETLRLIKPKEAAPKDAVETAIRDAFEAVFSGFEACVGGSCTKPRSMVDTLCEINSDCDDLEVGEGVCTGRFAGLLDTIDTGETNVCSDPMNLVVPLRPKAGGVYRKSRRSLALTAEPTPDPVTGDLRKGDRDKLKLTCLPPP